MHEPSPSHRNLVVLLLALAAVKLGLLLAIGPVHTPDSDWYIDIADFISGDRGWLRAVDLNGFWQPPTAFRILGYPALIAVAKTMSPAYWDWLVVLVQFGLSIVATRFVYLLAVRLANSEKVALFAAAAHGVGQGFVMDQCILTDSLNASILIMVASILGIAVMDKKAPTVRAVAGLGTLVLGAFLLREAGSVLQYLYWPLVLYWIVTCSRGRARGAVLMLAFMAPMVAGVQAYKAWNQMRTGERFVTTTAQVTLFQPSVELETRGIPVFAGDALLAGMAPLVHFNATHLMDNLYKINEHLAKQQGLNALEISAYGYAHYFENWRTRPRDMLRFTLANFRGKQAFLAFMPAESLNQLITWSGGANLAPAKGRLWSNLFENGRVDQLVMVGVRGVSRALSALITLAFLIGVPIITFREAQQKRRNLMAYEPKVVLMQIYWLMYFGYSFAYAMVHLEMRYLMPVEPLSMLIGMTVLHGTWARFKQRRTLP